MDRPRRLEGQTELNLTLPRGYVGSLPGHLAKRPVTDIGIRAVENRPVEEVEVREIEHAGEALSKEELLPDVRTLVVEGWISQVSVRAVSIAERVLRGRRKGCRVEYLCLRRFAEEVIPRVAVGSGTQTDRGIPVGAVASAVGIGERQVLTHTCRCAG